MASSRRRNVTPNVVDEEMEKAKQYCLERKDADFGFMKHFISADIGHGVFATKEFPIGSFLLEYPGDLIDEVEAEIRENSYEKDGKGCFMYYFMQGKEHFCIDGTNSTRLGAFVNDAVRGNCMVKKVKLKNETRLCLFAKSKISPGNELRYDYGDGKRCTWRKEGRYKKPLQLQDLLPNYQFPMSKEAAVGDESCEEKDKEQQEREKDGLTNSLLTDNIDLGIDLCIENVVPIRQKTGQEILKEYTDVIDQIKHVDDLSKENDEIKDEYKSMKALVLSYASERGQMTADQIKEIESSCGFGKSCIMDTKIADDDQQLNTLEEFDMMYNRKQLNKAEKSCEVNLISEDQLLSVDLLLSDDLIPSEDQLHADDQSPHENAIKNKIGYLKVFWGSEFQDQEFPIYNGTNTIGRSSECTVSLLDKKISVNHAQIKVQGNDILLKDCGSRNNTRHGKELQKLMPADEYFLNDGDLLQFGDVKATFHLLQKEESHFESNQRQNAPAQLHTELDTTLECNANANNDDLFQDMDSNVPQRNTSCDFVPNKTKVWTLIEEFTAKMLMKTNSRLSITDFTTDIMELEYCIENAKNPPAPKKSIAKKRAAESHCNGENVKRRKITCPVQGCNAERSHLKEHLITIHKWTDVQASCARQNFKLNLARPKVPDTERKTKARTYRRRRCPFTHCQREVVKMENHLKQFHKLTGVIYKHKLSEAHLVNEESSLPQVDVLCKRTLNDNNNNVAVKSVHETEDDTVNQAAIATNSIPDHTIRSQQNEDMPNKNLQRIVSLKENVVDAASANSPCNEEDIDSGIEDEDDVEYDYEDIDDRVIMSSSMTDVFFDSFRSWLQSVDGGLKKPRDAAQHRNTVMSILHYLDHSGQKFEILFSRNDLNAWVSYFESKGNGRSPGTVKTYLGSIKLFYKFVTVTNPKQVQVTSSSIAAMKEIIDQWCRNYTKKIQIRKHRKQLEELASLPTAEDIRKLDNADYTTQTKELFRPHYSNVPSRKEFCRARDYLITYLILNNASRSGAIANMTLGEYTNAEFQLSDASSIISIVNHKTIATAGPAMLSVSSELMTQLTVFVEKIRNKVTDITFDENDPVFPSWSGKKMAVSMVSTQLSNYWKQATGTDIQKNITATVIRKMAATAVHQNEPTLKNDLATLMNHDPRTAEKNYFLQDKKLHITKTSSQLQRILRKDYDEITPSRVREIFLGKSISMMLVREKMIEFPELTCWSEKQVYDRAKYYVNRKTEDFEVEDNVDENEQEVADQDGGNFDEGFEESEPESDLISVASSYSGTSRRRRVKYSAFEQSTILRECNSMVRSSDPIRVDDVEEMFMQNRKLKPLLNKFGLQSLVIKIRTERDKIKKKPRQ